MAWLNGLSILMFGIATVGNTLSTRYLRRSIDALESRIASQERERRWRGESDLA